MQLERLLHAQGFGSRRECYALIRQGRVMLVCCFVIDGTNGHGDGHP